MAIEQGAGSGEPKSAKGGGSGKLKGAAFLLTGLLIGVVLGALVLLSGPGRSNGERRLPPSVGSPVKDFKLDSLDGKTYTLAELKGKPVVINFWATWCAPCKAEMPLLSQYAEKYSDSIVVLGVNSGESAETVTPFLQENPVVFPILMDKATLVTDTYFVRSFPMTFFVDSEGMLRAQHLGMLSEDLLVRYLETVGIKP